MLKYLCFFYRTVTICYKMWLIYRRFFTCPSCWNGQLNEALASSKLQKKLVPSCVRSIYSETGNWEKNYGLETRKKVERWWRSRIKEQFSKAAEIDVSIMTK